MVQNKRNPKNILLNLMIFLCAVAMVVCGILFVLPLIEYRAGDALYLQLSRSAVSTPLPVSAEPNVQNSVPAPTPLPLLQLDYDALQAANDEFYAWLFSEGTVINYPVVQGGNNSYYLSHLFNKERNSMGTVFVDARNAKDFSDRNTILYGHHMKNGSMFASLVNYKEQTYYNVHPDMLLFTPSAVYRLKLFAGYVTDGYATNEVYRTSFATEADFRSLIENAREASDFTCDVKVTAEDRIVTLSTCTYEYDDARYVVLGKLEKVA